MAFQQAEFAIQIETAIHVASKAFSLVSVFGFPRLTSVGLAALCGSGNRENKVVKYHRVSYALPRGCFSSVSFLDTRSIDLSDLSSFTTSRSFAVRKLVAFTDPPTRTVGGGYLR
jgi:hypothetical protein